MPSVKERDHMRRLTSPAEVRELALLPTSWEAAKFTVMLVAGRGNFYLRKRQNESYSVQKTGCSLS